MRGSIIFLMVVGLWFTAPANEPELKTPNWNKAWSYHPIHATDDDSRFLVLGASRNGDELSGNLMFTNITGKTKVPPPFILRGTQMPDGSFWVSGTLEVSNDLKGPWKAVGNSHKKGAEISVTIPASLSVGNLNADFTPFRPFLKDMAWGRVVLPSGETAIIDLKELRD